jgi:hypothetical protein
MPQLDSRVGCRESPFYPAALDIPSAFPELISLADAPYRGFSHWFG